MDLNIEEFINEISPQENTLEDIQLVSGSSDPDTFPEDSFGLNEVPHIECSYPELGNEVNMGLSQTPHQKLPRQNCTLRILSEASCRTRRD